ncbi:hypothetical protein GQ651_07180 [Alphaproteobacteria bacterium GH1-50]|uniref:Uncharacterized protein n=1 Tax=Kangsaoukella pontilimi TaxID=2691042 RepID=A0A7C9IS48_9RHOB|nr:hypothetical protein [Kangsaoukella pontilimi]MXQ07625.1 hypothetical protein [Kangsaoukella pontilimi]
MSKGAYRVSFEAGGRRIRGLVPEALVAETLGLPNATRPEHFDVYSWIAHHRKNIESALVKMSQGDNRVKKPYDLLSLEEE